MTMQVDSQSITSLKDMLTHRRDLTDLVNAKNELDSLDCIVEQKTSQLESIASTKRFLEAKKYELTIQLKKITKDVAVMEKAEIEAGQELKEVSSRMDHLRKIYAPLEEKVIEMRKSLDLDNIPFFEDEREMSNSKYLEKRLRERQSLTSEESKKKLKS